jgi:transposase
MEFQVENFGQMLAGSLGLTEPWYIEKVDFNAEEASAHIYIAMRKEAVMACSVCGAETKRFGYEKSERVWRHADCLFYPCYVHSRRPRVLCPHCGTKQVSAPFERKNSRFTRMFEGFAMMLLPDLPVAKASTLLRCDEKSLVKIMRYWVNKAVESMDLGDVVALAMDETSFKRGHKYVTLIIDAVKRRVIDVEKNRDMASIETFCGKLAAKGGKPEDIETVTSDMSKTFLPAIAKFFPNAGNIMDKFHVKKVRMDALEDVRKAEQKTVAGKKSLFRGRRLVDDPQTQTQRRASGNACEYVQTVSKYGTGIPHGRGA